MSPATISMGWMMWIFFFFVFGFSVVATPAIRRHGTRRLRVPVKRRRRTLRSTPVRWRTMWRRGTMRGVTMVRGVMRWRRTVTVLRLVPIARWGSWTTVGWCLRIALGHVRMASSVGRSAIIRRAAIFFHSLARSFVMRRRRSCCGCHRVYNSEVFSRDL